MKYVINSPMDFVIIYTDNKSEIYVFPLKSYLSYFIFYSNVLR